MELPLPSLLPLAHRLRVCQVDNIKFTHQVCAGNRLFYSDSRTSKNENRILHGRHV
jgi:3-hydroxymyristoyl/3-hydroxydecanoyl-(acyl carrier protein) dehydratase